MKTTTIYLIHFDQPYKHARHYLGSTADLETRIADHRRGAGARLLQVIVAAGIGFDVVRTWLGDRKGERKLKKCKHAPRFCPLCSGEKSMKRGKLERRKQK